MIDVPALYKTKPLIPPATVSPADVAWVTKTYPPTGKSLAPLKPLQSAPVAVVSPGQRDFLLEPDETRKYNVRLFGTADTTLLLYELDSKGKETYIAGKTDVGSAENAALEERLVADRKYVIKVKVDYAPDPASLSIMAW